MTVPNADLLGEEARRLASTATDLIDGQRIAISSYLAPFTEDGRAVLLKRDDSASTDDSDPTDGATTTAFAVSRLARASSRATPTTGAPAPLGVTQAEWQALVKTIKRDFVLLYGPGDQPSDKKAAGNLPNYYSTPIHLSGLLAALRDETIEHGEQLAESIGAVVNILSGWLLEEPFVSGSSLRSEPEERTVDGLLVLADGTPNWYLTYLIVDALADYAASPMASVAGDQALALQAMNAARAASLLALGRMIALSSAGLNGIYDALDLAGCLSVAGRCVSATARADLISSRLINKGIELLGSEFLTPYGAFAPKAPVMMDRSGVLLEISSSELAEAALSSLFDFLNDDQLFALLPAIKLTCQRATGHRGWGVPEKRGSDRRDLFVASSSLSLLNEFVARMDQIRHRQACEALDVEAAPEMGAIDYPESLGGVISKKVISPIENGRRDLAAMSLLLYGPPGTAKTTIARKIASDLNWPILELTPSRLLLTGFEEITSRAEDLFGLLADLRDVVVLFDEFEGFIGRRDDDGASDASKFLTTFMLPKLHRLRDSGQVVFVVATNDESAIDSAASRPGRIDTVLKVSPPSDQEVQQVILAFARRINPVQNPGDEWIAFWEGIVACSTGNDMSGLTYGYINRWVKDVALEYNKSYNPDSARGVLRDLRKRLMQEQHGSARKSEKQETRDKSN